MTEFPAIEYQSIIGGDATGELLLSDTGLSFWGGVDPETGLIIDQHHPLHDCDVNGKILALPSGRGSCSGSGVMLELLLNEVAPAGLILFESEDILTLGVLVAEVLFARSIPVCRITRQEFATLKSGTTVQISGGVLTSYTEPQAIRLGGATSSPGRNDNSTRTTLALSETDQKMLEGENGEAAQLAMQIVVRMAELQGAMKLVDVSQAHIDACVYHGPSSLLFAQRLESLGGKVRIPTTLNAISVDYRRWRTQGVAHEFGTAASQLGDAYMSMGAQLSYTCAPYLLESAPVFGEQIVWAESNAVTYANSIIGARTQKYPDFLDACIALTARAPAAGAHLDDGRMPTLAIRVVTIEKRMLDDSFWPLLGYHIGSISSNDIPLIFGLENLAPAPDDHKAFSAAFATTSSVSMYHIDGITPEAANVVIAAEIPSVEVDLPELSKSWNELNSASSDRIDLVCLGNPHFSATECIALSALCSGRSKHPDVGVIVTMGRAAYQQAERDGTINHLEEFGVQFINDTCWCMIEEPIIPVDAKVLMTNSGKYAHYGPGLVNRPMHFGSLAECVEAACSGRRTGGLPKWLVDQSIES